jgi:hypothetical protein
MLIIWDSLSWSAACSGPGRKIEELPAGPFMRMSKTMGQTAKAKGKAIIQVHGR